MSKLGNFSLEDFKLSPEDRAKITDGLTERQTFMVNHWMNLHDVLNRGEFEKMDDFFDPEKMTYDNPNRPDLGVYKEWKTSPHGLWKVMPPCVYRTLKAWGSGENEICVLCHHHGMFTGSPYMGVEPNGNEINVVWFSWLRFEGDKIVHIYSISDVYTMLIDLGVIDKPQPVDPYED